MKNLKLAIVDDHELFLYGIAYLLEKKLGRNNFLKFSEAKDVLTYLRSGQEIDILISDIDMPDMNGIKLLSNVKREFPKTKVLMLSASNDQGTIQLCQNLGAEGYVSKDCYRSTLFEGLTEIFKGSYYFSKGTEDRETSSHADLYTMLSEKYRLTGRESEILQLILNEYVTSEIAEKLSCSIFTVKTHRRNLLKKMDVRNLAGLIRIVNDLEFRFFEK